MAAKVTVLVFNADDNGVQRREPWHGHWSSSHRDTRPDSHGFSQGGVMRLKQVRIWNFLSVQDLTLDFDNTTVLVGPNNHGKSNILRALNFFFNGCEKKSWEQLVTNEINDAIEVQAIFSDVIRFVPLLNSKHQEAFRGKISADDTIVLTRRMLVGTQNSEDLKLIEDGQSSELPTGRDSFLSPILPRFEYIPTSLMLGDVSKIQKTNYLGKMLFDILDKSSVDSTDGFSNHWNAIRVLLNSHGNDSPLGGLGVLEGEITANLQREFPECSGVSIVANLPSLQELTKGFTVNIDDGMLTNADAKGDGVQRALVFSILRTYQELQTRNKMDSDPASLVPPIVFALDEAELHLHPRAQRDLAETLQKIGAGSDQVILTTHSFIMAQGRVGQVVHAIEKGDAGTVVCPDSRKKVTELLGVMPSDINLPDNIVIVEGRSDSVFLSKLLELCGYERIEVHYADGESNVSRAGAALNQMFKTMGYSPIYRDRVCTMVDRQDSTRNYAAEFSRCFCSRDQPGVCRVLELDKPAVEYFYPKTLMKELYGDVTLDDDILEAAIAEFFLHIASSGNSHQAAWGKMGQVTKVQLAEGVAARMDKDSLSQIDVRILDLLATAQRLSSF